MKSKFVAYMLWFFFGWAGFHRFYVGKIFTGIIYLFSLGLFGFGWFLDLFLLSGYVDNHNALHMARRAENLAINNIVVNAKDTEHVDYD